MNVPTAAQLSGDFSNTGVPSQVISAWPAAYALPCNTDDGWQGCNKATDRHGKEPTPA